jgi:hypothetical protein
MFSLFDEENIWSGSIARAYKEAYIVSNKIKAGHRAWVFAASVCDVWRLIEGDDSPLR